MTLTRPRCNLTNLRCKPVDFDLLRLYNYSNLQVTVKQVRYQ